MYSFGLPSFIICITESSRGHAARERSGEIALPISHEQLAQLAAMSRAHVTVTLGKLRRRGVIRYKRGGPLLVDPSALSDYLNRVQK
jgi:CRP-like cAMP-binding protein